MHIQCYFLEFKTGLKAREKKSLLTQARRLRCAVSKGPHVVDNNRRMFMIGKEFFID